MKKFCLLITRKKLVVVSIILTMVLSLTGCGGGTTPAKPSESAKEPFKVGVIIPKSNVYAILGENIVNGMTMYFDEIGWKAGGRDIKLLQEDEENDPQAGLRKAKKLVEQDKVDMLAGIVNSSIALAIRDYADQNKVPYLVGHAAAVDLTRAKRSDYVYRISFSSEQITFPLGKWTYDNLAKNVFVIAPNYVAGKEMVNGFRKSFEPAGGKIAGEAWPALSTNDYGPYLQQIAKAKPDAVFAFFGGSDAVRFVQQYAEFGLKKTIPLIGPGWTNGEDVRAAQGAAVEGVKGTMYWQLLLDTPENKKFLENFRKKFGKDPSAEAVEGYDAARVIAQGLDIVKGDTSDKLKVAKAWGEAKFISPRGPIEFDKETHNIIQNIYLAETTMIDGKLQNKVIKIFEKVSDPI